MNKKYFIILLLFSFQNYAYAKNHFDEYTVQEHKLKIAFIFKFLDFVDNYQELYKSKDNIIVCVLGSFSANAEEAFSNIPNKVTHDKTIMVKTHPTKLNRCDVLYYTNLLDEELDISLESVKKGVITISDMPYFTRRGGMISFYKYRKKVGFKINNDVSRGAGVFFNAKLLELGEDR